MNACRGLIACCLAVLSLVRPTSTAPAGEPACPAGTVRREREVDGGNERWCARADGTRHGPYASTSQQLRSEGTFADGKMQGAWRIWSGATLVSEIHYDRGAAHGAWLAWTREGKPATRGRNLHGKRSGLWEWWHPNGRLKYRGRFSDDLPEGRHVELAEDGAVIAQGSYRKGQKIGRWVESDGRGSVARGSYARGERAGPWSFTLQGDRSAAGRYDDGKREGVWTFFFPRGGVSERGAYHLGRKIGRWTFFGGEGKRETQLDCTDGVPNGELVKRGVDSTVQVEGRFLRGEMDGAWTDHRPDGVLAHAAYRQGELVDGERMDQHAALARTLCDEEAHDFRVLGDASVD